MIYKVFSKILSNRLKSLLPSVVSENQSAFVPSRLITDNAIIALECFHSMKTRTRARKGTMAIKLDMSKAYDRVEWVFLKCVLLAFGFSRVWVSVIMRCVSMVS